MSRTINSITLVCYDIKSDKLRRSIDNCMKSFGVRLQFSVFLCRLDANGISRCREKLQKAIEKYKKEKDTSDSLIIFERFPPEIADCLLGARIERESSTFEII
jgi:CRISPR-associated endonuclease Cas2